MFAPDLATPFPDFLCGIEYLCAASLYKDAQYNRNGQVFRCKHANKKLDFRFLSVAMC